MNEDFNLKKNKENSKILEEKLDLENYPIAIKFINSEKEIPSGINIIDKKLRHCGMLLLASNGGKFYSTSNEQLCKGGSGALGLEDMPPKLKSGEKYFSLGRFKDIGTAKNTFNELSIIKKRHFAIVYAPLKDANFDIDLIVILAKPIVAMKLTQAIVYSKGKKIEASFSGIQSLCGDVVTDVYNNKDFNITIGCTGSRKTTNFKDEDLAIGISNNKLDEIIENLKSL